MSASIRFDHASQSDYPALLQLNEAAVPAVNSIPLEVLAELHQQALELVVARDALASWRIAGFLLALPESASYASENFQYFKRHYEAFAYVDRIVVADAYRSQGIGRALYAELFKRTDRVPLVTCEVNVIPPNPGSLSFHERLGFTTIAEQDTEGGAKRVALMARTSAQARLKI